MRAPFPTFDSLTYTDCQVPLSDNWLYVEPQYPGDLHSLIFEEKVGFKGMFYLNLVDFLPFWHDQAPWHWFGIHPLSDHSTPFQAGELQPQRHRVRLRLFLRLRQSSGPQSKPVLLRGLLLLFTPIIGHEST